MKPSVSLSRPHDCLIRLGLLTCFACLFALTGCGGGGGDSPASSASTVTSPPPPTSGASNPATGASNPTGAASTPATIIPPATPTNALGNVQPLAPAAGAQPSAQDAARLLTQATFGIQSEAQIQGLRAIGVEGWLWQQFQAQPASQLAYLRDQQKREMDGKPTEEMSYEAIWQQWLGGADQLRARTSWALLQIFVISNIAPDLEAEGMSSYMDMLNKNAFGNYRQLLEDVTLHPAMGYYLAMLQSEREDPASGASPNENYAREVLQLFSIGLVKLNIDGTPVRDAAGKTTPTFGEAEVKGFAKAFSGWSFGSGNTAKPDDFFQTADDWTNPMKAWPALHSPSEKLLLDGRRLPAGQTPQQDMKDALDTIFNHPNVGPFIATRLIQRLVTSNPAPAYVRRVAEAFNNNGSGVRGDLKATVRAVLIDSEARDAAKLADPRFGKQREPVIRLANVLRAMGASSKSGSNRIHYLDSADDGLGQSPLLAPSVFNFYSPFYTPPGLLAQNAMAAPEFQITSEITVVGSLNFFARLVADGGYGDGDHAQKFNWAALDSAAADPAALLDKVNALLLNYGMSTSSRATLQRALAAIPANQPRKRVQAALLLCAMSPDFVIQR